MRNRSLQWHRKIILLTPHDTQYDSYNNSHIQAILLGDHSGNCNVPVSHRYDTLSADITKPEKNAQFVVLLPCELNAMRKCLQAHCSHAYYRAIETHSVVIFLCVTLSSEDSGSRDVMWTQGYKLLLIRRTDQDPTVSSSQQTQDRDRHRKYTANAGVSALLCSLQRLTQPQLFVHHVVEPQHSCTPSAH